jgi:hypothetical protein
LVGWGIHARPYQVSLVGRILKSATFASLRFCEYPLPSRPLPTHAIILTMDSAALNPLLVQVLNLLTTQTGSLTYHLVLVFSLLGALQVSLSLGRSLLGSAALHRTTFGLGVLLSLQIVLFAVSLLGTQGVLNPAAWLPPVDRAVMLLSLVIFIWLWAFGRPSPAGDSATTLLAFLVITASVFGILWWRQQDPSLSFNRSQLDDLAQVAALVLTGLGVLLLSLRRPDGWLLGLTMLLLLAAGNIVHLLIPLYDGDYAGAVRWSQIASVYFLLMLPQRVVETAAPPVEPTAAIEPDQAEEKVCRPPGLAVAATVGHGNRPRASFADHRLFCCPHRPG